MKHIYLIGMMGSGKSVTGKRLAPMMGSSFSDLDDLIQQREKRTIVEIFQEEGEPYFRTCESAVLKEISTQTPRVVATGGGIILKPENIPVMKSTGTVIYLETSLEMLWQRVKEKKDRPLLKSADPREALRKIYEERLPLYRSAADFEINTDGQTAQAVADKIFKKLESPS